MNRSAMLEKFTRIIGFIIISAIVSLLSPALTAASTTNNEIAIYSAQYRANYNGLAIKAHHQLQQLEDGSYIEILDAKSILGKIKESAKFVIDNQQKIIPYQYSYKRSLVGTSRVEKQVFDWPNKQLKYTKNDEAQIIALELGTLDVVTHKLQLRRDLQAGKKVFSYPVLIRGKRKQYDYEVVASEILTTAIGPLNTTKIRRVSNNNTRETVIWLATDWDFLLVELSHTEKGDSHQLKIIQGRVNERDILPLQPAEEKKS
jgi:hypothetical protein